jgi:uncharacterized coiled-coil protein SlyX
MAPQKISNHIIEDLMDSERDESSVAEARRTITKIFRKLKEDQKSNSVTPEITEKNLKKTQQQLNELKHKFNKHQNETMKISFKEKEMKYEGSRKCERGA